MTVTVTRDMQDAADALHRYELTRQGIVTPYRQEARECSR